MKKLLLFVFASALALNAQITLVKEKTATADIVANNKAKLAIGALNEYLKKATGTALPVITTEPTRAKISFEINPALDKEAFKVAFPDATTIAISSGSEDGLKIAVWDFLERHLGIRWLFPGELGEVVPPRDSLVIPMTPYEDSPNFLSRQFSGGKTGNPQWQDKMRAGRIRVAFHHNLHRLYHPSIFAESHPEFYPMLRNGTRLIPKQKGEDRKWESTFQPCFTAPGIAEAGAARIIETFEQRNIRTYSLGVNDTNNHCTCPNCLAIIGDRRNFNGLEDYSPVFIPFANKIASIVSEKYPDCKLGFLAYSCILEPVDGLKLHGNLVPFMTFDRMMWIDKQKEAGGHALTDKWKALTNQLGWYDYIYGGAYDLPRVYFHHCADYIRWGYAHGVRHYYAEYYPREDWHEGPKYYLFMRLLWNINTNVDETLDEWYRLAVGPKAAPYLKEYYARLEEFWTKRVQSTEWFSLGHQYLNFHSNNYLAAYSLQDVEKSEELMNKVLELADNKPRAQHLMDAFQKSKRDIIMKLKHLEILKNLETREIPLLYETNYDDEATATKVSHWQRDYSRGSFSYDAKGGRNGSGALVIDTMGSIGTPMCYLEYKNFEKPASVRATVWFKADGLDENGNVTLTIKWMGRNSKGALDAKPGWLSEQYTTSTFVKNPTPGEWTKLTLTNITPDIIPCKMSVHLGANHSIKGKVYFDDFKIFAEELKEN